MMHPKESFDAPFDAPVIKKDPHEFHSLELHPEATRQHAHKHPYKGLAFHNPFEMNSYPITNPPILDSTMYLPYTSESGVPRRRRISISNGQIGQIVNHEAFFMDEDLLDDFTEFPPYQPPAAAPAPSQPQQRTPRLVEPMMRTSDERILMDDAEIVPMFVPPPHPTAPAPLPPALVPYDPDHDANMAGVPPPNHQLIYNNEVIYNPNNGPIPGTAAWKKERLLERNRVAASKCRQRKKQAQQQLQDNMDRHERKISDQASRLKKYEAVLRRYNAVISAQLDADPSGPLAVLAPLLGKLVDDISPADLS